MTKEELRELIVVCSRLAALSVNSAKDADKITTLSFYHHGAKDAYSHSHKIVLEVLESLAKDTL